LLKRALPFFIALILTAACLSFAGGHTVNAGQGNSLPATCCSGEEQPDLPLKPKMYGGEVREYQIALKQLGFYFGDINGIYNQVTENAVKKFQRVHKLKDDGIIGKETKKVLIQIFETRVANTSSGKAPKGYVEIVIDTRKKTLTVYDDGKEFKQYKVAVGKDETPTPIGNWRVKRKAKNWGTGFGTRWMGLDVPWGLYGIHGTNKPWSIGAEASHGCIRMFNSSAEEVYEWVKPGTVVKITGQVYPPLYEHRDKVHKGHRGSVVMLVQKGLIAEGYLKEPVDGIFGYQTETALKKLQKDRGFEVTGQVDIDIWPVLGL